MDECPGRVLLDGFVDRPDVREHDLDPGSPQPVLDGEAHPAANHDVAVANGIHQIMMATAMPRIRVVALCAGADLADLPRHFNAVYEVDDDEGFGPAEVSGDGVSVQGGKCDSHGVQDTGVPQRTRRVVSRASSEPTA